MVKETEIPMNELPIMKVSQDKHIAGVIAHHTKITPGNYVTIYQWSGKHTWPLWIADEMLEEVRKLPWPIVFVGRDWESTQFKAYRTDNYTWWLRQIRDSLLSWVPVIKARIVATFRVWVPLLAILFLVTGNIIGAECLTYSPPPLFNTSSNPEADPSNKRSQGITWMTFAGHRYLVHNTGNNLAAIRLDDPLNPGPTSSSNFRVPFSSDRDYQLFNFSVCDNCRFGGAWFDMDGSVLFDLGELSSPTFSSKKYPDAGGMGGFTFKHGDQQYLIGRRWLEGCIGKDALYTIDGTHPEDLALLRCVVDSAGVPVQVLNGHYLPGSPAYLYLVTTAGAGKVEVYEVSGSGAGLTLTPRGSPFSATWIRGRGVDIDLSTPLGPLAAVANSSGTSLWSLSNPAAPTKLAQWDPWPAYDMNSCALQYPYLWVATKPASSTGTQHTYDITDPSAPVEVAFPFWDETNPWIAIPYSTNYESVFTADAAWLFMSRYSVVLRVAVDDAQCRPHPVGIFADGFETGSTEAWAGR